MKRFIITCDWCRADITKATRYVGYQVRFSDAVATYEGAQHTFEFCNDECFDAWRSHDRRSEQVDKQLRAQGI